MAIKQIQATQPYQDPAGNVLANGYITLDLSQPAVATGSGDVAPMRVSITLDATGKFSATNLWANDQLTPSGTTYLVLIHNSNGLQVANLGQLSIQGTSPIDISQITPNVGGSGISIPGVVLLNPTAAQAITGQSLTLTSSAPLTVQGAATFTGATTISNLDGTCYIDGTIYAKSIAGIQAALNTSSCIVVDATGLSGIQTTSTTQLTFGNPAAFKILKLGNTTLRFCVAGGTDAVSLVSDAAATNVIKHIAILGTGPFNSIIDIDPTCANVAASVVHMKWSKFVTLRGLTIAANGKATTALLQEGDTEEMIEDVTMNTAAGSTTSVWTLSGTTESWTAGNVGVNGASASTNGVTIQTYGTAPPAAIQTALGYGAGDGQNIARNSLGFFVISATGAGVLIQNPNATFTIQSNTFDIQSNANTGDGVDLTSTLSNGLITDNHIRIRANGNGGWGTKLTGFVRNNIIDVVDIFNTSGGLQTVDSAGTGPNNNLIRGDLTKGSGTNALQTSANSTTNRYLITVGADPVSLGSTNDYVEYMATAGGVSNVFGIPQATAYQFSGTFANPTTTSATFLNQSGIGPTISGFQLQVRVGTPTPAAQLLVTSSDMTLTTAGTGTTSVATLGATQSFTNKTLNVPLSSGTGLQIFNTTTTCTTGASVGATCTTAAISLPVAEADTSYRVICTGKGPTAVPVISSITNSSATQFTITIAALTAVAASFSSYDCVAGHN